MEIYKILRNYRILLEKEGFVVLYIGLYGSQNYNLADSLSDIDAKAIVLPTLQDIIMRKKVSKVIETGTGSIDIKDLLTFYEVIKKGNFSYIECIETEYAIGDKYLKELFKVIKPNLKSIIGAMKEKRKNLSHPFPSKKEELEKWGFDPKQYHHIVRLFELLKYNIDNKDNKSYLRYTNNQELLNLKRNKDNLSLEEITLKSDNLIKEATSLIDDDYQYEYINLDKEIIKYIETKLRIELLKKSDDTFVRCVRTFDDKVPKGDLEKFPILKDMKGDISYIVVENLEIL